MDACHICEQEKQYCECGSNRGKPQWWPWSNPDDETVEDKPADQS